MAGQIARRYQAKECRQCGKAFFPKHPASKTCSVSCQRADRQARKTKVALENMRVAAFELENADDDLTPAKEAAHENLVLEAEAAYAEALAEGRAITPEDEADVMFAKLRANDDEVPSGPLVDLPKYLRESLVDEELGRRRARTRKRMAIRLEMLHPFDVPVILAALEEATILNDA